LARREENAVGFFAKRKTLCDREKTEKPFFTAFYNHVPRYSLRHDRLQGGGPLTQLVPLFVFGNEASIGSSPNAPKADAWRGARFVD
jgi:hypothetical protein